MANGLGGRGNNKSNLTDSANNFSNGNNPNNGNNNRINDQIDSLTNPNAAVRSSSAYKPNNTASLFRPEVPTWSKHSKAFTNKTPTGVTEYKFIYG